MSEPLQPGRVDQLAKGVVRKLIKEHRNPEVRNVLSTGLKFFEEEVDECLKENLGPGTTAHKLGQRIMRVLDGEK